MFLLLPLEGKNRDEAVFNNVSKSYVLNADGSQQMRVIKELTIFTHTAMNRTYGETFIPYTPEYQTLVINESYTKQVDGTIVRTPSNAFVECLRSFASNAPMYNGEREMVVVHTGLELGATIYLDYTITSKAGYYAGIDLFEIPRETSPVKNYSLTVTVPEGKPLRYASLNADYSPKISKSEGCTVAKWSLKNLPALSREPGVSVTSGGIPVISVVSFSSTLYTFPGFKMAERQPNTEIPSIKRDNNAETIALIKKYISENYDLVPTRALTDTRFIVRSLNDIISSAYGNEIELTYLMNQMFMNAGITSYFIARYPFKMAINDPFGLSSVRDFMIKTPVEGYPLVSVKLSQDELAELDSDYSTFLTINSNPEIVPITSGDKSIDVLNDVYIAEGDLISLTDGCFLFNLPPSQKKGILAFGYEKYGSSRSENILLPYEINEKHTFDLYFPKTFKLSGKGRNVTITNSVGSLKITTTPIDTHVSEQTDIKDTSFITKGVTITRTLTINKRLITPADYPAFRALMCEWGDANGNKIILSE